MGKKKSITKIFQDNTGATFRYQKNDKVITINSQDNKMMDIGFCQDNRLSVIHNSQDNERIIIKVAQNNSKSTIGAQYNSEATINSQCNRETTVKDDIMIYNLSNGGERAQAILNKFSWKYKDSPEKATLENLILWLLDR